MTEDLPPDINKPGDSRDESELTLSELLKQYGLIEIETEDGRTLIVNEDGTPLTPIYLNWKTLGKKSSG